MEDKILKTAKEICSELGLSSGQEYPIVRSVSKLIRAVSSKKVLNSEESKNFLLQRKPPHNTEAERALLAKMVRYPDHVLPLSIGVNDDSFFDKKHSELFLILKQLWDSEKDISLSSIAAYSGNSNISKKFVRELNDEGSLSGIEDAVSLVKSHHVLREMWELFQKEAYEIEALDVEKVHERRREIIERLGDYGDVQSVSYQSKSSLSEALKAQLQIKMEATKSQDGIVGKFSPIHELTKKTGGWKKDQLIILAARPAMGKTAFALCDAWEALKRGERVVFYSLEMSTDELMIRLFCIAHQMNFDDIIIIRDTEKGREVDLSEEGALIFDSFCKKVEEMELYIDETPAVDYKYVLDSSLVIQKKHGQIDRIYVDYVQLMASPVKAVTNLTQYATLNSNGLKRVAKTLNCPVLALSQLSRKVEERNDKRPKLADLRETGALEQDADIVAFFYRPEYYEIYQDEDDESTEGLGEIIIRKQRGGSLGIIKAFFNAPFTKWDDWSSKPFDYSTKPNQFSIEDLQDQVDNLKF